MRLDDSTMAPLEFPMGEADAVPEYFSFYVYPESADTPIALSAIVPAVELETGYTLEAVEGVPGAILLQRM
eukprot:TRINITY_DN1026_c0_g1_i1.p4 TRINITY_DN1026_c0_g1~~TRINITY_DN1026_c0_g1_i1.p4  ORF type:complete len:71 (+),score=9.05 TRINITY_DN1026_c0_g1_i1:84-296(+)